MPQKIVENWHRLSSILVLASVLGMLFGLGACNPAPTEATLPFETIEQKELAGTGKPYELREPGLIIISRIDEVNNLNGLITDEAKAKLQAVDYSGYFALLVLQGWKPTMGYKVSIDHIARIENTVNIYAEFLEPEPDKEISPAETSPYHLVKVQKTGNWDQDITFNLFAGERLMISLSRAIP